MTITQLFVGLVCVDGFVNGCRDTRTAAHVVIQCRVHTFQSKCTALFVNLVGVYEYENGQGTLQAKVLSSSVCMFTLKFTPLFVTFGVRS